MSRNQALLTLFANIDNLNVSGLESIVGHVGPDGLGVRNQDGETLLHLAVKSLHPRKVSAVVNAGADLGAKDNWGLTPLGRARNLLTRTERYYKGADRERRMDWLKQIIGSLEAESRRQSENMGAMKRTLYRLNRMREKVAGKPKSTAERLNAVS